MKKILIGLAAVLALGLGGCLSLNIAGTDELGGVDLGASVDPIHGRVGASAGKTVHLGDTSTAVGVSSNGLDTSVNTNTRVHPHHDR
jgi:hypothetical protein